MRRPSAVEIAFLAAVLLCGSGIVARLAWRRAAEKRTDLSAPSYVTTVPSRHMLKTGSDMGSVVAAPKAIMIHSQLYPRLRGSAPRFSDGVGSKAELS
jgi:hypothetical protein